jgi:hypothetical protein
MPVCASTRYIQQRICQSLRPDTYSLVSEALTHTAAHMPVCASTRSSMQQIQYRQNSCPQYAQESYAQQHLAHTIQQHTVHAVYHARLYTYTRALHSHLLLPRVLDSCMLQQRIHAACYSSSARETLYVYVSVTLPSATAASRRQLHATAADPRCMLQQYKQSTRDPDTAVSDMPLTLLSPMCCCACCLAALLQQHARVDTSSPTCSTI